MGGGDGESRRNDDVRGDEDHEIEIEDDEMTIYL